VASRLVAVAAGWLVFAAGRPAVAAGWLLVAAACLAAAPSVRAQEPLAAGEALRAEVEITALSVDGVPVRPTGGELRLRAGQILRLGVTAHPPAPGDRFQVAADGMTWAPPVADTLLQVAAPGAGIWPLRVALIRDAGPGDTATLMIRVDPAAGSPGSEGRAVDRRSASPLTTALAAGLAFILGAGGAWFLSHRRGAHAAAAAGSPPVPPALTGAARPRRPAGTSELRTGEGDLVADGFKTELEREIEQLRARASGLEDLAKRLRQANRDLREEISFLEESNRTLRELQRRKEEVLAMVAHDIKNPAGAIAAMAELLQTYDARSQEQQQLIENIALTASRVLRLTQELGSALVAEVKEIPLDLKVDSLRPMVEAIVRVNQTAALRKGVAIRTLIPANLPQIEMDGPRIEEVLDNLVSNAIKYSRPDSEVRVELKGTPSHVTVEITDSGAGLSEKDLAEAFQFGKKLSTTPTAGEESTGIGLWIVRKIVEAHHGVVYVRSAPGKGSTFTVKLPTTARG